jgi:hypothetical protein
MTSRCLIPKLIPIALLVAALAALTPDARALPAPGRSSVIASSPNTLEEARIANQNAQAAYYRSQIAAPAKRDLPPWFNAVLPLVALVLGSFLTYLVAARQSREAQDQLYKRQKSQVRSAVCDLSATLESLGLNDNCPLEFLQECFLIYQPERPHTFSRSDAYYQKYYLVNLVYRLCAVLGWMELYRVDSSFLRGPAADKRKLETSFFAIRKALSADSAREMAVVVPGDQASPWTDGVILDDDQRAIGETMLTAATKDTPPVVFGYGAFCVSLFRFAKPEGSKILVGDQNFWIWNATRFIVDMGGAPPDRDLRRRRLTKVLSELRKLEELLA